MRASRDKRRRYRLVLRALRDECPLMLPARVVLCSRPPPRPPPGEGSLFGWSWVGPEERSFRIVVKTSVYERGATAARPVNKSELVETLLHEWAHCMAWKSDHADLHQHGPGFGLAYAACYRAIIED